MARSKRPPRKRPAEGAAPAAVKAKNKQKQAVKDLEKVKLPPNRSAQREEFYHAKLAKWHHDRSIAEREGREFRTARPVRVQPRKLKSGKRPSK
jgi:hypothetical protein